MTRRFSEMGMTLLAPVTLLLSLVVTALLICNKTLLSAYAMKTETLHAYKAELGASSHIEHLKATLLNADAAIAPLPSEQIIHSTKRVTINGEDLSVFTISGRAKVHQSERTIAESVIKSPILLNIPTTPFSTSKALPKETKFEVGIPDTLVISGDYFSVWSGDELSSTAPHQVSCLTSSFDVGNCTRWPLSSSEHQGSDFYLDDANFPPDLIHFLFGLDSKNFDELSDYSAVPILGCDQLNEDSSGMYIAESDCKFSVGAKIGSPTEPVLLVGMNINFKFENGVEFYGLIVATCIDSVLSYDIKIPQDAYIGGALMTDCAVSNPSSIRVRFNQSVLSALRNHPKMQRLHRVPGSWRDF